MTDLFRRTESHETAARLSIASGSSVFEAALHQLPIAATLWKRGFEDLGSYRAIATRIGELASQTIDSRYLHPHDIPLAIYLRVLRSLDRYWPPRQRLSEFAATDVLLAPNCFWANRVALGIQTGADHDGDTTHVLVGGSEVQRTPSSDDRRISFPDTVRLGNPGQLSLSSLSAGFRSHAWTRDTPRFAVTSRSDDTKTAKDRLAA